VLIEDDPAMGRLVQRVLARSVCRITVCPDPDSALEVLSAEPADVVLQDIALPSDAGTDLGVVRKMDKTPVVVLTDIDDEGVLVDCVEAGAFDLLLKPFAPEQLEQCVSLALGSDLEGMPGKPAPGSSGDRRFSLSEARFLEALTTRPGQTVLYQEILRRMYGRSYREYSRLGQAWASRLKKKVRLSEFMGVGYALVI